MGKYFSISTYVRKLFLIYDFVTDPLWISLYMRNIWFSFLSVYKQFEQAKNYLHPPCEGPAI
jgi:hypothetical protein